MLHITRRQDATSNTLQLRPGLQSYNNNTSERASGERAFIQQQTAKQQSNNKQQATYNNQHTTFT